MVYPELGIEIEEAGNIVAGGKAPGLVAAFGLLVGLGSLCLVGCEEGGSPPPDPPEQSCGVCGTVAMGQVSISGNPQLDGFFTAVADLQGAAATLRGNVEGELRILGSIYGLEAAAIDEDFMIDLAAAIRNDINSSVLEASFRLEYHPPRCSANVDIAIEAQARCEAHAGCEIQAQPVTAAVQCGGTCTGSCSGGCSGSVACNPPDGSDDCDLGCEGACALETPATCEGVCRGLCSGFCSATVINAAGDPECAGECDAMCDGTCELSGVRQCAGTCHGTCHAPTAPPECEAVPVTCDAECTGTCEGGCIGEFTPPSASAECEASPDCYAQASAQADANFACSPPTVDFAFELDTSLEDDARARFLARLDLLRRHLASALQSAQQARALVYGEINGETNDGPVLDPPPITNLMATLQGFVDGGTNGFDDFDISPSRTSCLIPALAESLSALADVQYELQATASVSLGLFAIVQDPTG